MLFLSSDRRFVLIMFAFLVMATSAIWGKRVFAILIYRYVTDFNRSVVLLEQVYGAIRVGPQLRG